jgi:hypothetical protein
MPYADRDRQLSAVPQNQRLRPLHDLWRGFRARWYGARQVVEWDEIDVKNCVCLTTLFRQGWSPALVRRLLGRPDYAILDLQGIRSPLRLYTCDRITEVLSSDGFKQHMAKLNVRNPRAAGRLRRWSVQHQLEVAAATADLSVARQDAPVAKVRPPAPVASP